NTSFGGKYTRLWRFGDGSFDTAKSTTHTYSKAGSYNVTLVTVAAGGCADSINKTVSVFDNPVVKFGASSSCLSNPVMFTDSSTLNGTSATYSWSFGDATTDTLQNPSHKYSSTGSKTVTLSVTNNHGCSAAKSKAITVDADPDAKFSSTVVSPTSYSFAPSNTTYSGYSWNFGDGNTSTTQSPTHSYTANGSYKVKLTVDNGKGCTAVDSTTVTITGIVSVGIGNNLSIFPNPFMEATNINYSLAASNKVNITVYDVVGRMITTLVDAQLISGNYNTTFTPADWNSNKAGVYLIRISIGDAVVNKEVILVK
ncbi:MAG: PKD domain-containing protein, partial [Bacteroidetes bacterium]|nr:PKD domain-containing protein [Bacteroidota bacterium]